MLLALLHVVGALIASCVLGLALLAVGTWNIERVGRRQAQELSIALGVQVAALDEDQHLPKVIDYNARRYSSELLRNRLSDLCGVLRVAWDWLGNLVYLGVVGGVLWEMYSDGPQNAVYMWTVLGTVLFFWIVSFCFSLVCALFTGRYPGEARRGRKVLASVLEEQTDLAAMMATAHTAANKQ